MSVGFIGLGTMGAPMAMNLVRSGVPLRVWNRTRAKCEPLRELGAIVEDSVGALFAGSTTILVMLLDELAIDDVIARGTPAFAAMVAGRTLVNLGTVSTAFSRSLADDLARAGASYVEAPVSGSRVPAERGSLVGMLAGDERSLATVRPLLAPLCNRIFDCGGVPNALRMKLAVNHYLIVTVAALGEAFNAARAAGVDVALLKSVLDAGPMASDVSRLKLDKLVRGDLAAQASVHDAGKIAVLALEQAEAGGSSAPLLARAVELYRVAERAGWGALDMIAATCAPELRE